MVPLFSNPKNESSQSLFYTAPWLNLKPYFSLVYRLIGESSHLEHFFKISGINLGRPKRFIWYHVKINYLRTSCSIKNYELQLKFALRKSSFKTLASEGGSFSKTWRFGIWNLIFEFINLGKTLVLAFRLAKVKKSLFCWFCLF